MKFKILIPVYNDWQSLFRLLENIDHNFDTWDLYEAHISVIIVNDSSTEKRPINKVCPKSGCKINKSMINDVNKKDIENFIVKLTNLLFEIIKANIIIKKGFTINGE